MSTAGDLRSAVADALVAGVSTAGFAAYERPPASVNVPCAFVTDWTVDYTAEEATLDGTGGWELTVLALASRNDDVTGWTITDELLDEIRDALYADPTLSGLVPDLIVTGAATDGSQTWAGVDYFGCQITVRTLA